MSESATTDHQDPQKSVLLKIYALPQQTQAFTQQSTPAVYAFAVPAPNHDYGQDRFYYHAAMCAAAYYGVHDHGSHHKLSALRRRDE